VTFHEGWLKAADARKARTATREGEAAPTADIRPEMSGPMADYIGLHRHAAARASLILNPAIAMRLMTAHTLCGSSLWHVRLHTPGAVKAETLASVGGGIAAAELAAARERVEALFEALGAPVPRRSGDAYHLCETFAALLAMLDAEVMHVTALAMAETLESGGPAVEAVLHACGADLREFWKPDDAFLDLLRDRRAINAMVADIGSASLAETCASDTAKAQKMVIGNRITGEGCTPNPDWRPGWMQVPPTRLVDGAGSAPADASQRCLSFSSPLSQHGAARWLPPGGFFWREGP